MTPPETGGSDGQCQRCGTPVSTRFRKVFGTNDATIYGCIECMTLSDLCEGKAAEPEEAVAPQAD